MERLISCIFFWIWALSFSAKPLQYVCFVNSNNVKNEVVENLKEIKKHSHFIKYSKVSVKQKQIKNKRVKSTEPYTYRPITDYNFTVHYFNQKGYPAISHFCLPYPHSISDDRAPPTLV
jgi:hypothetical protein